MSSDSPDDPSRVRAISDRSTAGDPSGKLRVEVPETRAGESANDGMRPGIDQLREIEMIADFTENPLASVLCEVGRTVVLCTVSEETSVPRFLRGKGQGWITAE